MGAQPRLLAFVHTACSYPPLNDVSPTGSAKCPARPATECTSADATNSELWRSIPDARCVDQGSKIWAPGWNLTPENARAHCCGHANRDCGVLQVFDAQDGYNYGMTSCADLRVNSDSGVEMCVSTSLLTLIP